jgi:hypothetical protein
MRELGLDRKCGKEKKKKTVRSDVSSYFMRKIT